MAKYEPKCVLKIAAELGEHPVWSAKDQCLFWIDIEKETFNRFDPASGENTAWVLPSAPGCFVFRDDGAIIIAAQDGFYQMDLVAGTARQIIPAKHDASVLRFNDGRTDRQGRFWVCTVLKSMDMGTTADNGWYRLDERGLEQVLTDVGVPNGTAFSPDGRTMYRAQTEERRIFAYDYDPATGSPSNMRLFAQIPEHMGMPDGACVDDQGGLWTAIAVPPGGGPRGGVARFTPDGVMERYIELPVPFVTMPAFGGSDLSTLYVITARLEAFMPGCVPEGAGDLYAMETDFRGFPETPLKSF